MLIRKRPVLNWVSQEENGSSMVSACCSKDDCMSRTRMTCKADCWMKSIDSLLLSTLGGPRYEAWLENGTTGNHGAKI
jgi:hypothetical protein